MPRACRASLVAVLAGLLAACGGGDAPEARAARRLQIEAAMMAEAARRETPAYACLRSASTQLMAAGATPAGTTVDCLAGVYRGKTSRGDGCVLEIGANAGRFQFQLEGTTLHIGTDTPADGRAGSVRRHAIERAEVESDQIGLRLLRSSSGGAASSVVETVVVSGGRRASGTADLTSVVYERVAGQSVRISRCFFDG